MIYYEFGKFYDLIYKRKNYKKECSYVDQLFQKYNRKKPQSILELGCGTANHMLPFLKRGCRIVGIDQSSEMLKFAQNKIKGFNSHVELYQQDMTSFSFKKRFDAVLAMFSVVNYLTRDKEIIKTFKNVARHMKPDALFIFDFWHDEAVEGHYSPSRDRLYQSGHLRLRRQSRTTINKKTRLARVNYTFTLMDPSGVIRETKEKQVLRYFSIEELSDFLSKSGLRMLGAYPFLSLKNKIKKNTWDVTIVAEKA